MLVDFSAIFSVRGKHFNVTEERVQCQKKTAAFKKRFSLYDIPTFLQNASPPLACQDALHIPQLETDRRFNSDFGCYFTFSFLL